VNGLPRGGWRSGRIGVGQAFDLISLDGEISIHLEEGCKTTDQICYFKNKNVRS